MAYWGDSESAFYKKLEKVIEGDKEKFKKYLKKGFNPQNNTHVASMPIKDMYSSNLPTLITDRERRRVAEELAKSLEEGGKIDKKDKKEVSEELTKILKQNSDKLNQDKDLIELIKINQDEPIDYESGDVDEEDISNAGDFEIKIPKQNSKLTFKYSMAPIPSPEATSARIEELYKIDNSDTNIVDVTINENHSVFSTFTSQESRNIIIRMVALFSISEHQTNIGLSRKEKGGTMMFRKNLNIFSMNTLT